MILFAPLFLIVAVFGIAVNLERIAKALERRNQIEEDNWGDLKEPK